MTTMLLFVLKTIFYLANTLYISEDDNQINLNDDDIAKLNYVEMVIQESVRYVNVAATFRRCTKPWKIPDTDIIIPVGTDIVIPIMSLHRDPEYWEDPDRFDPERFAPENKAKIRKGAYQPFGQGKCNLYVRLLNVTLM